jgi:hypothetical protein
MGVLLENWKVVANATLFIIWLRFPNSKLETIDPNVPMADVATILQYLAIMSMKALSPKPTGVHE